MLEETKKVFDEVSFEQFGINPQLKQMGKFESIYPKKGDTKTYIPDYKNYQLRIACVSLYCPKNVRNAMTLCI